MNRPNSTALAALDAPVSEPAYLAFLDILGDPIRVTSAPYSLAPVGTGDADLDGVVFSAQEHLFMGVSPVETKEGGGSTVTCTLSGMLGIDTDLLNQIGNKANWQGHRARLWAVMLDPAGHPVGNMWCYFTGYMTVPKIIVEPDGQTIVMTIESWTTFYSRAACRTWLMQKRHDEGDQSAAASISIANGTTASGEASQLAALAAGGGIGAIVNRIQLV